MRRGLLFALCAAACTTPAVRPDDPYLRERQGEVCATHEPACCRGTQERMWAAADRGDDRQAADELFRLSVACPGDQRQLLARWAPAAGGGLWQQGTIPLEVAYDTGALDPADQLVWAGAYLDGKRASGGVPAGDHRVEVDLHLRTGARIVRLQAAERLSFGPWSRAQVLVKVIRGAKGEPFRLRLSVHSTVPGILKVLGGSKLASIGNDGAADVLGKGSVASVLTRDDVQVLEPPRRLPAPPFQPPPELVDAGAPPVLAGVRVNRGAVTWADLGGGGGLAPLHPRLAAAVLDWLRRLRYQPASGEGIDYFWVRFDGREAPRAAPALPPTPPTAAPSDRWLAERLEAVRQRHGVPGMAVAIVRDGRLEAAAAAGWRKLGNDTRVKVTDGFHLGSISKVMTATLVGILVDAGVMRLEMTMAEAFPELVNEMAPAYRTVTLAQLMAHRGGQRYFPNAAEPLVRAPNPSLVGQHYQYARVSLHDPPEAPPGTRTIYSGGGNIAAAIAERATGRTYEDLMQEYLFAPLGMSCRFGGITRPDAVDGPFGHELRNGKFVPVPPTPVSPHFDRPHRFSGPVGGVICSAPDVAKFLAEHLPRSSNRRRIVSDRTLRALHTPVENSDFAPGWQYAAQSWLGPRILWHGGAVGHFFSRTHVNPERNYGFVVLTNASSDRSTQAINEMDRLIVEWLHQR